MKKQISYFSLSFLALAVTAHAATYISGSFNSTLNTRTTINTTGANVVDWGYLASGSTVFNTALSNANFTTLNQANYDASSGIGAVTFTRGALYINATGTGKDDLFTFTGGNSPATGTSVAAGAWFSNFANNEANGMTLNFNNMGLGTHTVYVYLGHRSTQDAVNARVFDMNYNWTASDGNVSGSLTSTALVPVNTGDVINSVFQMTVTNTVDAGADLSLTLDSVSGASGNGFFSGYMVETIPEPSTALLGGLGALLLLRRRR